MAADLNLCSSDGVGMDNSGTTDNSQEKEKELVLIQWKDIIQTSDWTPAHDVTCPTFQSVGWLIYDNEKEIKIGSTLVVEADDPQGTPYGITAFPKGCVLSIHVIGE